MRSCVRKEASRKRVDRRFVIAQTELDRPKHYRRSSSEEDQGSSAVGISERPAGER